MISNASTESLADSPVNSGAALEKGGVGLQSWWFVHHAPVMAASLYCCGQKDYEADYAQVERLQALAALLPRTQRSWWTSPLRRAYKTALAVMIMQTEDLTRLKFVEELTSQSLGVFEGEKIRDLQRAQSYRLYQRAPMDVRPPFGESRRDVFNRVSAGLQRVAAHAAQDDHIIIFGDSDPARVALAQSLNVPVDELPDFDLEPLNGVQVMYDPENRRFSGPVQRF